MPSSSDAVRQTRAPGLAIDEYLSESRFSASALGTDTHLGLVIRDEGADAVALNARGTVGRYKQYLRRSSALERAEFTRAVSPRVMLSIASVRQ